MSRAQIGRYDLLFPLGQGGMATVFAGRLSGMAGFEKLVAIKVIHPHLADQQAFVDMFLDEARIAARIHHPNVGEILDVGEDEGLYYMVGELIAGQPLNAILDHLSTKNATLPHGLAAYIAAKVCRGLHAAHQLTGKDGGSLNLIHRDVTPQNILISYDGAVKLIDFGVAFARDRLTRSETGALKGKVGFMSPEQFRGEPLDRRSDLFSVGVVLYLMLTGRHPFEGTADAVRMQKILSGSTPAPRSFDSRIDPVVEQTVLTALANRREDRFATTEKMAESLDAFLLSRAAETGSGALAAFMQRWFRSALTRHKKKLRQYKKGVGGPALELIAGNTVVSADQVTRTDVSRPASTGLRSRLTGRTARIGGSGLVALIGVLVIAVTRFGSSASPSEPAEPIPREAGLLGQRDSGSPAGSAEPKMITVHVDVSPTDARLVLDGERLAPNTTRFSLAISETPHKLVVKRAGYVTLTKTVVANADQSISIVLDRDKNTGVKKRGRKIYPRTKSKRPESDLLASPYRQ